MSWHGGAAVELKFVCVCVRACVCVHDFTLISVLVVVVDA